MNQLSHNISSFSGEIEYPEGIDLIELQARLKEVDDEVDISFEEPVYEIETNNFTMDFAINDNVLEVRSMSIIEGSEVSGEDIIETIQDFAEENELLITVLSTEIKEEVSDLWQKMGYVDAGDGSLAKED